MLMNREKSVLLVVDMQAGLMPAVHGGQDVVDHCVWLARLATRVGVPVVVTEHFPHKLGATIDVVAAAAQGAEFVGKEYFSAHADGCLAGTALDARRQIVVCGAEAHVCVQQTALELRWSGKEVFVVADATGSRDPVNRDLALQRMRQHGIDIVSREMVAFEWLQRGGSELFREIHRDFIR